MNNLLLIDDHQVIRSGIRNILRDLFKPEEIFEAFDEDSAVEQLKARPYKLVITDVKMPGSQPFGLTEYITVNFPGTRVLIFSMNEEFMYAKRFLQAGAMGFVSKNADLSELRKAIGLILQGKKYVSENLGAHLIDRLNKADAGNNPFEELSRRELEISVGLISGQSLLEIAKTLNITQSTVGTVKTRIFKKLGVKNLAQLIEIGKIHGL
jgi:two-component system, NarL family, invasion response regulator UvrY